ncbi:MAG: hypothetical protein ACM32E_09605 [Gemmatimonadota bacterium]
MTGQQQAGATQGRQDAPGPAAFAGGWPAQAGTLARRHWLFAAVLAGAAALRAVVMSGYPPAMWFNDSYSYVSSALARSTSTARPGGYPIFLILLEPFHSFALVVAVQHLMGLAVGAAIYALLRRWGLPAWGAVLAAVPVLYDAYQVQVEQQIMSDTLFILLVTAAVVLLCWDDRVAVPVAAAAGLLTGLATIVRSVGLPLLAALAVCLLAWRVGWRPLAALLAAGAVPVAGYLLIFFSQHHQLAMTDSGGTFLYGRVQTFAQCSVIKPPAPLAGLCDPRAPAQRPVATEYIWRRTDPLWNLRSHGHLFSPYVNARAKAFAIRAIEAQPLSYLGAVGTDFWRSFAWSRSLAYDYRTDHLYLFSIPPPQIRFPHYLPVLRAYQPGIGAPRAVQPFAGIARAYQRQVYLRGTLLGVILLAGLAGVAARWRAGGGPGLLPWLVAALLLVFPIAVAGFDYRYLLAVTPLACLAAGLAAARGRRAEAAPAAAPPARGTATAG